MNNLPPRTKEIADLILQAASAYTKGEIYADDFAARLSLAVDAIAQMDRELDNLEKAKNYIRPQGGVPMNAEGASECIYQAMRIIEKVGTVGIEYEFPNAKKWMSIYFPNREM